MASPKNLSTGGSASRTYRQAPARPATKYKPKQQAEIIALACSNLPKGRLRWTLQLLANHAKS